MLLILAVIASLAYGCATAPNPNYTVTNPQTGQIVTNPVPQFVYVTPPAFVSASNAIAGAAPTIAAGAAFVPAAAPFAPIIQPVLLGGLSLASLILGAIAKNRNDAANSHAAAAASMAQTINASPGAAAVAIGNAPNPDVAATIAQHLALTAPIKFVNAAPASLPVAPVRPASPPSAS